MSFGVIPLTFRPEFLDLFFSLSAFSLSFFYFRKIDGMDAARRSLRRKLRVRIHR